MAGSPRRLFGALLTLALPVGLLALVPSPTQLQACAPVARAGVNVRIIEETALIAYESATKTEHFLRTAHFNTTSADFGFFVPTPSQPELAEASTDLFPMLADITKPAVVHRTVSREANLGCSGSSAPPTKSAKSPGTDRSPPPPVVVYEQKRIGAIEAVVLKAENAKALQDWLKENQYASRPALESWFREYIRKDWFITAFKIGAGESGGAVNPAVRISFKSDVPVYPYLEPSDQPSRPSDEMRLLRLFVLSDARVEGTVGTGEQAAKFAGATAWSKPVESAAIGRALAAGKIPDSKRDWHLTEFEDRSDWRGDRGDLYLTTADDQSAVERPPVEMIEYEWTYGGYGIVKMLLGSMSVFVLIALLLFVRSFRRNRIK